MYLRGIIFSGLRFNKASSFVNKGHQRILLLSYSTKSNDGNHPKILDKKSKHLNLDKGKYETSGYDGSEAIIFGAGNPTGLSGVEYLDNKGKIDVKQFDGLYKTEVYQGKYPIKELENELGNKKVVEMVSEKIVETLETVKTRVFGNGTGNKK